MTVKSPWSARENSPPVSWPMRWYSYEVIS